MEVTVDANESTESDVNLKLDNALVTGDTVTARLMTDERVFARITDGIYRDPASALRELIANAYDADATEVRVETDYPRFNKISVRDNGKGLTKETLAHVICHIGGSLKRTKEGQKHQISSDADVTRSKAGRPLIGKLGIGLFSVSQITHHIVIISKIAGSNKRIYCDILLMPQSEAILEKEEDQKFVTGEVSIKFVDADDVDSQGTEIILLDLRNHVKEALLSKVTWTSLREKEDRAAETLEQSVGGAGLDDDDEYDGNINIVEPVYHIGEIDPDHGVVLKDARLPWDGNASGEEKFRSLVDKVFNISDPDRSTKGPSIAQHLDYYLRMLWVLSLSIPIPYLHKHPFSLDANDGALIFQIDNKSKGSAVDVNLLQDQTITSKYRLKAAEVHSLPFNVYIDGIKLFRPLSFGSFSQIENHAISKPLFFVGRAKPDLSEIPEQYRGGELEFEAYLYWSKKIVPREHNGVLIRINGASGTLFDENFLKYQVSEQTRLRQITAEIFVIKGLDAALNIDRESFNIAHPHYQIMKNWLHSALRQLMNKHKYLASDVNKSVLQERKSESFQQLREIVVAEAKNQGVEGFKEASYVPSGKNISLSLDSPPDGQKLEIGDKALKPLLGRKNYTVKDKLRHSLNEEKAKSLASLLSIYGVDRFLPEDKFETLISAILEVMILEIKK
ncbi:ATP-binding protein [Pseudomonas alvandae]|uniref:ATP-binding protein n=1 Tax=Pseudomonas canavaninivorans TaxID=2842348 RepID=UPI00215DDE94|nr:ATP-binding protein [Pseudomonas canavaninivorans]UVM74014.1 ATP-binding protein [Pseudomonas canavaninivorans]